MDFKEACYYLAFDLVYTMRATEPGEESDRMVKSLQASIEGYGQAICDLIVNSVAVALTEGGVLTNEGK